MNFKEMASLSVLPIGGNKKGWPWTEESQPLTLAMDDPTSFPKLTIVTPTYNHAEFLEETIRSVLLQGYPNLEYIIIDGGSKDGSVEIIKKYEKWLSYWVSEPDEGPADAINKGFARATGVCRGWINSDDYYLPNAFSTWKEAFDANPEISWLTGTTVLVDRKGDEIRKVPAMYQGQTLWRDPEYKVGTWLDFVCNRKSGTLLPQQASFWSSASCISAGILDTGFKCAFDHEYYVRLRRSGIEPHLIEQSLAVFRKYEEQISASETFCMSDELKIIDKWYAFASTDEKKVLRDYNNFLRKEISRTNRRKFLNKYRIYRYFSKQAWKMRNMYASMKRSSG